MTANLNITPKEQAVKLAKERDTLLVELLVKAIEERVRTRWSPDTHFSRVLVYPDEVWHSEGIIEFDRRMAAVNTVVSMYNAAGWEARYNNSQRDGDWIEVK